MSLDQSGVPAVGSEWIGVGPYREEEWVRVVRVDPDEKYGQRVVYDVLEGSDEGRTMSMPAHQWRENFTPDA